MADSLGSWLAKAIIQHDKEFGANLETPWMGSRYCQLIQFDTYRTPEKPHAEVTGRISDQSHFARVTFDVSATDKHEEPVTGLPVETLTSHLRAVFRILSFRFRLLPSPRTQGVEVPRVVLDILQWEVHSGDRNDPVFWDTHEMGTGAKDGEVQRVLRKWWFGESTSDPSQPGPSSTQVPHTAAGPSHHRGNSPPTEPARITLAEFLDPYLHPPEGKKPKPIPEWIFELPDEAKRQLENVHVFGLDLAALDVTPRRQAGSVIRSERKGKGREVSPSIRSPPPGQATYPNATDSPISGKPYVKAVHQADSQLDEDNSDSEEEGMPIRPLTQGAKSERRVFDPLSFATGSEPSGGNQSDKETEGNEDEDGLSDYEKKQRRRGVAITLAETGENESQEVKITVTVQKGIQKGIQKGTSFADLETASQSLPESQRSAEDFTLSRYADPLQLHAPELPASATSRVLVDDSDQSHPQTVGSHSLSQGAPQPNAIQPTPVKRQRSSSPISRGEDSHPNAEADTSAEAHADDELSQQGSAKRVKTSPPSALSFLNPLNYLRSASRPLRMKEEPVSDPSKRTKGSSSEERIGGSASGSGSVWRKLAVWGRNDEIDTGDDQSHYNGSPRAKISSHQDGSPSAKIFSPKAEVLISKSPSRALALRAQLPSPISAKKRSVHSPAKAQVTRQPVFEPNDQHSARSTRLPSPPVVRHPKLRGFRPDLVPLDGLSKKWVGESTKVAEDFRRAKAARGKTA